MNPADAERLALADGETVMVSSPRGSVEMPVRIQPDIPVGLTFTTFHFPELVDINLLTNDAWDKKSGTAEFKAASIRVEKLVNAYERLRPETVYRRTRMTDLHLTADRATDAEVAAIDAADRCLWCGPGRRRRG